VVRVTNRDLWAAGLLYGDPTKLGAHEPLKRLRNAHPEQAILNAVMQALRLHPRVAWVRRMNSGAYQTPDGRYVKFGFAGCSDVLGQMRDGRLIAIEIKARRGRVSSAQRAFIDFVIEHHGVAGIVRSIDEALALIDA
jgi:VRR-NUC domain